MYLSLKITQFNQLFLLTIFLGNVNNLIKCNVNSGANAFQLGNQFSGVAQCYKTVPNNLNC
jgi:hypothetical protein